MKIKTNGYYDGNGNFVDGGRSITDEDMKDIARAMDDDIRERIHFEMAPCGIEEFLQTYLEADPDFEDWLEEVYDFSRD